MSFKRKISAALLSAGLIAGASVAVADSASAKSTNKVFNDTYSSVSINFVDSQNHWVNVRPGSPTPTDWQSQPVFTKGFYAPAGCIVWTNINGQSTWTRWEAGRDHLNAFSSLVPVYNMWVDCVAPWTTPGYPRLVPGPER
jgi:hypothetical protein